MENPQLILLFYRFKLIHIVLVLLFVLYPSSFCLLIKPRSTFESTCHGYVPFTSGWCLTSLSIALENHEALHVLIPWQDLVHMWQTSPSEDCVLPDLSEV